MTSRLRFLSLLATIALTPALTPGCATDTGTATRSSTGNRPESPGTAGEGTQCSLDLTVCTQKATSPAEQATCEELVTLDYDRCVRAEACTEQVLAVTACGDKPNDPAGQEAYLQCLTNAQAALDACIGNGTGPGTGP
jgi:hypothetical protein